MLVLGLYWKDVYTDGAAARRRGKNEHVCISCISNYVGGLLLLNCQLGHKMSVMIDDWLMCSGTTATWFVACDCRDCGVNCLPSEAGREVAQELHKSATEMEQDRWIVHRLAEEASVRRRQFWVLSANLGHTAALTTSFKSRCLCGNHWICCASCFCVVQLSSQGQAALRLFLR